MSPTVLSTFLILPLRLSVVYSLAAEKCNLTSSAAEQPNANAIFLLIEIADLAKAKPTCLAAHTNMILYLSDNPRGVSVFPVPVGAI